MTAANKPVLRCCVCGVQVPYEKPEILMQRGLCTVLGNRSRVFHCRHHTAEEIVGMLNAVPQFKRASEYK